MNKLRKLTSSKSFKKAASLTMCLMLMFTMCFSASAADSENYATDAVSSVSSAFSTVTSIISIGNIFQMVGIALAACVGFFFFWWGIRKVIGMVTKAFKKGKISV